MKTLKRYAHFPVWFFPVVLLLLFASADAADYQYLFNTTFNGTSPGGPAPWLDVTFHNVSAGKINLTISNEGLVGSEFVGGLYLNLNPNLNPAKLKFKLTGGNDPAGVPKISTGENQFQANGGGLYDIRLQFPTATSSRFEAGDYLVYQITGPSNLTVSDFGFPSAPVGASPAFLAAAQIESINNCDSIGWIRPTCYQEVTPVPEPKSAALFLLGALSWVIWCLGFRRKNKSGD